MEAFRSQGMKALYGVIISAIGVVFLIQFRPGAGQQQTSGVKDTCAAEVRGECITVRDFRTSFGLIAGRRDESFIKQAQLRRRVMDGLVERSLLAQDAERLGVGISDDDLNEAITRGEVLLSVGVDAYPMLPFLQLAPERPMRALEVKGTNGKFDRKIYNRSLKQVVGRGEQEFREMQQREHLASRMRDLVRSRVRLSEDELFDTYARMNAKASIKYVKLSRQWFARGVDLSNAAVDAFAGEHKTELDSSWESAKKQFLPECRKASHILVKADHTASDDERAAARKKIEDARERVKKGDSFASVARDVSEDSSATDGGSLGCFQKGRMVKPFEDAVFSMKPGELSAVVETEYGFHVIQLDAIVKDADAETEGRRQIARDRMKAMEADAKSVEAAKRIQALVTGGKSLEDALAEVLVAYEPKAKKRKKDDDKEKKAAPPKPDADRPKVEEAKDFAPDGTPIPGVTTPDVAAAAFALAKPGDTTADVLKLDGAYAVIQLVEKKPASKETFAKERDKLARDILSMKQQDALYAYVTRLRDVAKSEVKVNQTYVTDPKAGEGEDEKE